MSKKISISFKDTKKDNELYNILMGWEDKTHEIKEILRKHIAGTNETAKKAKVDVDITDF